MALRSSEPYGGSGDAIRTYSSTPGAVRYCNTAGNETASLTAKSRADASATREPTMGCDKRPLFTLQGHRKRQINRRSISDGGQAHMQSCNAYNPPLGANDSSECCQRCRAFEYSSLGDKVEINFLFSFLSSLIVWILHQFCYCLFIGLS